jgi:predicted nucleotidyltransferase
MAGLQRLSEDLKQRIVSVLRNHGVIHAAVFGSLATGLAIEESDLPTLEKSLSMILEGDKRNPN